MKKEQQLVILGVPIILAVIALFFSILHGSPVIVRGGSLYGRIGIFNTWQHQPGPNGTTEYYPSKTKTGQNEVIRIANVRDSSGNTISQRDISAPNGWTIDISNRHGDKVEKKGAVCVCSDANCSGTHNDTNGEIFLMTMRKDSNGKPNAEWKQESTVFYEYLYFQDKDKEDGCGNSTSEEKVCDTPVAISIKLGSDTSTYTCIRDNHDDDKALCTITFSQ